MGSRLPKADVAFNKYTDTELISRAQQVHNRMTANAAFFATPPVTMLDLQAGITAYKNSVAAARKGTKAQTNQKNVNKTALELQLKQLAEYVTYLCQSGYISGSIRSIEAIRGDILFSGFKVSDNPSPVTAGQGLDLVQVIKAISLEAGKLKILIRQYTNNNRNTLLYKVNYRTSPVGTTPAGPWITQIFTGQKQILLEGLTSGIKYDWQIAAIGGRDVKRNEDKPVNFTPISTVVII